MTSFSSLPPLQSLSVTATPAVLSPDVEIDIHEMIELGNAGVKKLCANWSVFCDIRGDHPMCSDENNERWKQGCVELGYIAEHAPAIPHTPHVFTWKQWFNTICSCLSDLKRTNLDAFMWYLKWMMARALPADHFLKDPQAFANAPGVYNGFFSTRNWERRCASEIGSLCWHSTPAMQTAFEPLRLILESNALDHLQASNWDREFDDLIFVDKESALWGPALGTFILQSPTQPMPAGRNAVVAHMKRYMWSGGDPDVAWKKMLVNNAHIKEGRYFEILLDTLLQHPSVDVDMIAYYEPYEGARNDELKGPRTMLTRVLQYRRGPDRLRMLTQLLDAGANPNVAFDLRYYKNYVSPKSAALFTAMANIPKTALVFSRAHIQLLLERGATYGALSREYLEDEFHDERIPGMHAFKLIMTGDFFGSSWMDPEFLELRSAVARMLFVRGARPDPKNIFEVLYKQPVRNWGVALFVAEHALANGIALADWDAADGVRIQEARRAWQELHVMRAGNQPQPLPVRRTRNRAYFDRYEDEFLWVDDALY